MASFIREQHAPAVQYPAGAVRHPRRWVLGMGMAGFATLWFWLLSVQGWSDGRFLVAFALWVVSSGAAWHAVVRGPSGTLAWDGLQWSLDGGGALSWVNCRLEILLDLQRFMLVRLTSVQGKRIWLSLESGHGSAEWSALRRAVYSRPKREPAVEGPTTPPAHRSDA
ncbi:hypothetical protein M4R22_07380 [Acidovorax sp. GBBC 3334]|uniref:hypothetical protein n=1 Tax=Acidovorax sp. GBBC 3334 TaxID=2940496 RepID=UPI00230261F3|nr:hypothetical protein [Acidovorax sp. GBBC 3334]MDA8454579.1 hypothetical protein [Acidovorax sp. GBBC 3334]